MQNDQQVRQLKILSSQTAPLGVFVRVGFYLFGVPFGLGLLSMLCHVGR